MEKPENNFEDLEAMYIDEKNLDSTPISNDEFKKFFINILKFGLELWAYSLLLPLIGIFIFRNNKIADIVFLCFYSILGIYFIILSFSIFRNKEVAEYWYFKPMRYGSIADTWGPDFKYGIRIMKRLYAPLFLIMGIFLFLITVQGISRVSKSHVVSVNGCVCFKQ